MSNDASRPALPRRARWFALFSVAVALSAAAYVAWRSGSLGGGRPAGPAASAPASQISLDAIRSAPHVYYRSTRRGEYSKLVVGALDAPGDRRFVTDLDCERLALKQAQKQRRPGKTAPSSLNRPARIKPD